MEMRKLYRMVAPENASEMTRRGFLVGTAATSVAAAAPAAAEASAPLADDQQIDACVAQLKAAFAKLHPGVVEVHQRYEPHKENGGYTFWLIASASPARVAFDGPGFYEIEEHGNRPRIMYAEECFIAVDGKHYFRGNYVFDDRLIGPSVIVDQSSIARKCEPDEVVLHPNQFVRLPLNHPLRRNSRMADAG